MRILHGADAHVGFAVPGSPTATGDALLRFAAEAAKHDVDLAVWSGDTFHTRRPAPSDLLVAVRAALALRAVGIPLVIGTGNHDGYTTIGDASSHTLGWWKELDMDGVYVLTEPGETLVSTRAGTAAMLHLPYPHKRAGETEDLQQRVLEAGKAATDAIARLAEDATTGLETILIAHVSVTGARLGAETAMKLGWDAMVDAVALEPFTYAALGHIHLPQPIADNAWYAGSGVATGFGDDTHRGWLLVDTEQPGSTVLIPSGGPEFRTIRINEGDPLDGVDVTGKAVKVVIKLAGPAKREGLTALSRSVVDALTASGARFVRVEVEEAQRQPGRRPAPESLDVETLVEGWLRSRDAPLEPATTIARQVVHSVRNGEGDEA